MLRNSLMEKMRKNVSQADKDQINEAFALADKTFTYAEVVRIASKAYSIKPDYSNILEDFENWSRKNIK